MPERNIRKNVVVFFLTPQGTGGTLGAKKLRKRLVAVKSVKFLRSQQQETVTLKTFLKTLFDFSTESRPE
jgi:hypothetical protein